MSSALAAAWPDELDRPPLERAWDEAARSGDSATKPHVEYQTDPIAWAVDKLGVTRQSLVWSENPGYGSHKWDGDIDPLVRIAQALADGDSVGAESGTGTGKSFLMALLILWFNACWENSRVFTFAPKEDQLRLFIWTEIGKLWPRFQSHFPEAEYTDLCIRMRGARDDSWGARGVAVGIRAGEDVATKAAGMHAEHMLLVYEETPGIDLAVLEAGENTCTAPHNLRVAIGNPNHQLDSLHRFCTSGGVVHVRMSALDHPNVVTGNANLIPGATSQASITRRLMKYGETSPVYLSRVKGLSPEQASDALIRLEWLKSSAERYNKRKAAGLLPTIVTGKGVDVANSEHGDRAAICDFADNAMVRLDAFQCPDANQLGRQVNLEITPSALNTFGLDPRRVGIDAIGVGAGTVNELRRFGKMVTAINASSPAMRMTEKSPDGATREWSPDVNQFKNLRSQMYWQAREDLRMERIDVPEDPELWEELTAPTFVDEPKTIVEKKEEIKERLGRSPDKADAFVMANWVRIRNLVVPEKTIGDPKIPDRARTLVVKDGRLVPPRKEPRTAAELAEWAENRTRQERSVHRVRLPRRTYR